tara:strand:+ start:3346 stop:3564 length:219 start_codon:yes stop_codon:yes gene_type:complete
MRNKTRQVLAHLLSGRTLTPIEAFDKYRTMRLGAIIFNLKKEGETNGEWDIVNENPKSKHGLYRLTKAGNAK